MLTVLLAATFGLSFDVVNAPAVETVAKYDLITPSEPLANVVEFTAPATGPEVPRLADACTSGNCPAATKTTVRTATTSCESGACGSFESSEVTTYNERPRRRGLFGGLFKRGGRCRSGSCQ